MEVFVSVSPHLTSLQPLLNTLVLLRSCLRIELTFCLCVDLKVNGPTMPQASEPKPLTHVHADYSPLIPAINKGREPDEDVVESPAEVSSILESFPTVAFRYQ